MRIVKDTKSITLPEDSTQRFFIQAWYSLVHMNSLDSHRVRCMNAVNIIDELMGFLSTPKAKLPGINDDVTRAAEEVVEILSADEVVQNELNLLWQRLQPLLKGIAPKQPPQVILSYYLGDVQSELRLRYKTMLLDAIYHEVFRSKNHPKLFSLISSLLSILIHEGHSINELFTLIKDIFISSKSRKTYSFADNFNFVSGILKRSPSQYEIIFRLQGCSKFDHFKSILGEKILQRVELPDAEAKVETFLSPGQNVLFANIQVFAQDDRSAGLRAKRELDGILDLIRFELEESVISVDDNFISVRKNDHSARRFRLPSIVPNPTRNIAPAHFEDFIVRFNRFFEKDGLTTESKDKIRSALRFYRMGRDSDLFENKFLNWWTALEYLTRTGDKSSIIEEVKAKLIPTLVLHYLSKHLVSYTNALRYCGVQGLNNPSAVDLFEMLIDPVKYSSLISQLDGVPFLKFRLESFKTQTADAKMLGAFISRHEKRLDWHLHRIWRIRCDIVHSAEYSLNLNLLSANLEYYLKSLLTLIIENLTVKQQIGSIDEFYVRYQYAHQRLHQEIKSANPDLYKLILSETLL